VVVEEAAEAEVELRVAERAVVERLHRKPVRSR
jgi:hypothetical protein